MTKIAAQTYQDQLSRIKKLVESEATYFEKNRQRFHSFRNFVFNTSLTENDLSVLKATNKPQIECPTIEPFISRLLGEFSKQQPSISISTTPGYQPDPQLNSFLENHSREILQSANQDSFENEVYKEEMTGGYSVMKVWTEYMPKSFDQVIKLGKVYDPTLAGFDPLARQTHKGDGRFWFELYPKTEKEFKDEYDIDIKEISFSRNVDGFNWSYTNNNEKILLICDFYEKKKKKIKIVKLSDGRTLNKDDYDKEMEEWQSAIEQGIVIQQPPVIVKERFETIDTICRYRFIENCVLEYVETDYGFLNGIFVDGNSVYLKQGKTGSTEQMTRPYGLHAKGIQRLKNFAMQSLANELENLVQHKYLTPKEAIPEQYQEAYQNPQLANNLVYNSFYNNNPSIPLNPPREIVRPPIPPEIANTFAMTDNAMQMVLGSFDAQLGINNNQLSGIAIVEAATQSNSVGMPYITGFLAALTQSFQVILDLIPKYYKTPRTLPIVDAQGKRTYVMVNVPGGINLNYEPLSIQVNVEAGVNFSVQKSKALQQIIALMQASPLFAQFMNQEGLEILLDNLEIRGVDLLKTMAQAFMQKMKAAQSQQQPNPAMVKLQQNQQQMMMDAQQNQAENQLKAAELSNEAQANEINRLKVILAAQQAGNDNLVQMAKAETEHYSKSVDLVLKANDQLHKHTLDIGKHTLNEVNQTHQHLHDNIQLTNDLINQSTQGDNQNA